MREILFRGKRKDTDEWAYGFYTLYNDNRGMKPAIITETENNCFVPVEIIPETLGQFAGLIDNNGVKIFEGDILKGFSYPFLSDGNFNYYNEVFWSDECAAFVTYTFKSPDSKVKGVSAGNCDYMEEWESYDWEIIGNIHDNPELVEREHNETN